MTSFHDTNFFIYFSTMYCIVFEKLHIFAVQKQINYEKDS